MFIAIEVKDNTNDLRLFLIDGKNAPLLVIAIELVIFQYMTVFDCLFEAKFQPFGKLSHFILGNTCHDHQQGAFTPIGNPEA